MNQLHIESERTVTNISELSPKNEMFVQGPECTRWRNFSGLPENIIEKAIRKPRLSRLRAAWQGVGGAGNSPIISHLPRMTAAVALMQKLRRNSSPHLAFAFNFTDIPVGIDRHLLANAFARVDRFYVFSRHEAEFYPSVFGLDPSRFKTLIWTQGCPAVAVEPGPIQPGTYVVAVGGEGRDYAILLLAARALPRMKFVIIARPGNVTVKLPPNVTVMTNVPASQAWRIAQDSLLMVVPLRTPETRCGHITLVSSELLGIPIVTSSSLATSEYTEDCELYPAGNLDALVECLSAAIDQAPQLKIKALSRVSHKRAKYDRSKWESPVAEFLTSAWNE